MGRRTLELTLNVSVRQDAELGPAVLQAVTIAKALGAFVAFEFKGIHVCAGPDSVPADLCREYGETAQARAALQRTIRDASPPVDIGAHPARVPKFVMWADLDDVRDIWNWWNEKATLETMFEFFEFLRLKGLVK